jgi:ribose 5-phosphate isomerase
VYYLEVTIGEEICNINHMTVENITGGDGVFLNEKIIFKKSKYNILILNLNK